MSGRHITQGLRHWLVIWGSHYKKSPNADVASWRHRLCLLLLLDAINGDIDSITDIFLTVCLFYTSANDSFVFEHYFQCPTLPSVCVCFLSAGLWQLIKLSMLSTVFGAHYLSDLWRVDCVIRRVSDELTGSPYLWASHWQIELPSSTYDRHCDPQRLQIWTGCIFDFNF